jgi:hypothetical protein
VTVVGIGVPDAQDQGSYTSGRVGPDHFITGLAAGAEDIWTPDPAAFTNLTLFHLDADQAGAFEVVPVSADGTAMETAELRFLPDPPGGGIFAVPSFGGGYEVRTFNIGATPLDAQITTETLFKSTVRTTVAPRFDLTAADPALGAGSTLSSNVGFLFNVFDVLSVVAEVDQAATLSVQWVFRYFDSQWRRGALTEVLSTQLAAGVMSATTPVRAEAGFVLVRNDAGAATAAVTLSSRLSATS